jgi:hypothetical protein
MHPDRMVRSARLRSMEVFTNERPCHRPRSPDIRTFLRIISYLAVTIAGSGETTKFWVLKGTAIVGIIDVTNTGFTVLDGETLKKEVGSLFVIDEIVRVSGDQVHVEFSEPKDNVTIARLHISMALEDMHGYRITDIDPGLGRDKASMKRK